MGPMGPEKTVIGVSTLEGSITCTLEGYEILPLPYSYVGEVSACYFLHTPCNP